MGFIVVQTIKTKNVTLRAIEGPGPAQRPTPVSVPQRD